MTLFLAVLPLRLCNPTEDLTAWRPDSTTNNHSSDHGHYNNNNNNNNNNDMADLHRVTQLRQSIGQALSEKDAFDSALQALPEMHQYYHCLVELERHGYHAPRELEWESALTGDIQGLSTLAWERANLIWNLATLEAYQASQQSLDNKLAWNKAAQHLQNAATWLQHAPTSVANCLDFSEPWLQFWQAMLLALSQRSIYESLACAKKPKHLLLAKLAAAAVPLLGQLENLLNEEPLLEDRLPSLTGEWADVAKAWGMFMSSQAEYHQAMATLEKQQWGQTVARLQLAYRFAKICCDYCERAPLLPLRDLHTQVDAACGTLTERLEYAEQQGQGEAPPDPSELPEIRGETLAQVAPNLDKILRPFEGPSLFDWTPDASVPVAAVGVASASAGVAVAVAGGTAGGGGGMGMGIGGSDRGSRPGLGPGPGPGPTPAPSPQALRRYALRRYVDAFHANMDQLIYQWTDMSDSRTDSARKALNSVNLPHSVTAYRQEQAGGGIPDDLWQRVQTIQRDRRIPQLKQELWELQDCAEGARITYQKIHSQLDMDLDEDRYFRQEFPAYEGLDVQEVQKPFRQTLVRYERMLQTAQEGDSVSLRRLENLDANPKYKLLQFQKSQLDRLLPGAGGSGDSAAPPSIDTSQLSWLLVELSSLFRERTNMLNALRDEVNNYDIEGALRARAGPSQDFQSALEQSQRDFDDIIFDIESTFQKQNELLDSIMAENEQFMRARQRTNTTQTGDSCISMIEDAIEEIDLLSKNLKDGKFFYDSMVPNLKELRQQVEDASARLAVERLEYDDKANRNKQELEDAQMAKRMFDSTPNVTASSRPGSMSQVRHGEPQVFVDDEKVATLVAMEFDPAKVVAALTKYNNNVDQALNDLLSA
eukprot:Nitzschia sp. Nitz4//scaffold412_size15754//3185//5957//NITZ4_008870-RA/size15754-processed-gene-0.17-mRNA-1//-1//CDS//3329551321//6340//frame0